MRCQNCGAENPEDKKFCGDCGVSFSGSTCPNCGSENSPGKKYCGDCGAPLLPSAVQTNIPSPPVSYVACGQPRVQQQSAASAILTIGRPALIMGFALIAVSVILFVLSNALTNQAERLLRELDPRWADVLSLAHNLHEGAVIVLIVAIVVTVIGAITYWSSR